MSGYRRRPVPREWREANHRLDVWSRIIGSSPIRGGGHVYRARGRCYCGVTFNQEAGSDTMDRAAVIEAWKDHVEDAYYEREVSA